MIKYKTIGNREPYAEIGTVKIDKQTEKCIWINGRRITKMSEWECYFDTWRDAHNHILGRAQGSVESARVRLDRCKGILGNIKGMKEDE